MNRLVCAMTLACVALTPQILAEEEVVWDAEDALRWWGGEMREELAFATWPGKNGALKKGLAFNVADYPALNGWVISKDGFDLRSLQHGLIREMVLRKPPASSRDALLKITVAVAHGSTDNAHELLLRLGPLPTPAGPDPYARGDQGGIAVGDLNIVHSGFDPSSLIAFARNNVVCALRCWQSSGQTPIDLVALAKEMDAKIKALPDLTPAQFDALRPAITTFAPAAPSINQPHGSTTLSIVASDPSSESLKSVLTNDQGIRLDPEATPPIVRTGYAQAGDYAVKLVMANQSLLFSTAETKITVKIPGQ